MLLALISVVGGVCWFLQLDLQGQFFVQALWVFLQSHPCSFLLPWPNRPLTHLLLLAHLQQGVDEYALLPRGWLRVFICPLVRFVRVVVGFARGGRVVGETGFGEVRSPDFVATALAAAMTAYVLRSGFHEELGSLGVVGLAGADATAALVVGPFVVIPRGWLFVLVLLGLVLAGAFDPLLGAFLPLLLRIGGCSVEDFVLFFEDGFDFGFVIVVPNLNAGFNDFAELLRS